MILWKPPSAFMYCTCLTFTVFIAVSICTAGMSEFVWQELDRYKHDRRMGFDIRRAEVIIGTNLMMLLLSTPRLIVYSLAIWYITQAPVQTMPLLIVYHAGAMMTWQLF